MRLTRNSLRIPARHAVRAAGTALALGIGVACGGGGAAAPTPTAVPAVATVAAVVPAPSPQRPALASPAVVATPPSPAVVSPATPVPPTPEAAAGTTYEVQSGDTLLSIAREQYGDTTQWRRIYDANKDVIGSDPDKLKLGMTLKIPPKQS